MKRISVAVSVVVLALAVAVQAQTLEQTKTGTVEQELLKLEQDWTNANVKADFAFVDRILADDYVNTDFDGVVKTKGQYIEGLKLSKELVISSMVTDEMKVYVYGEAAVVIGHNTVIGTYKGTFEKLLTEWAGNGVRVTRISAFSIDGQIPGSNLPDVGSA